MNIELKFLLFTFIQKYLKIFPKMSSLFRLSFIFEVGKNFSECHLL